MAPYWAGPWRGDLADLHTLDDVGMFAPWHQISEQLVGALWSQIELVAAALMDRGELTGADLITLLRGA